MTLGTHQDPAFRVEHRAEGLRELWVPAWVSAHSHAFQFGLRGQTQRSSSATGTFWSWREAMYSLADAQTPESLYALSLRAFQQLARHGVAAVGEFHYLHHNRDGRPYEDRCILSDTVIRAARAAGLKITLLRVAYARGGPQRAPEGAQKRFADADPEDVLRDLETLQQRWAHDPSVVIGLAPHSVRAVPKSWLEVFAAYGQKHPVPVHIHVGEQQAEIDACLAEHRCRPVELLAAAGLLSEHLCAVHCTLLSPHEVALLAQAQAFVCLCPTTERDLGDGLAELSVLRDAALRLCVGIDSHVLTDPLEELRALETHERLRLRKRTTFHGAAGRTLAEQLLWEGSVHGAWALGLAGPTRPWERQTRILVEAHGALGLVPDETLLDALVFSGSSLPCEVVED